MDSAGQAESFVGRESGVSVVIGRGNSEKDSKYETYLPTGTLNWRNVGIYYSRIVWE